MRSAATGLVNAHRSLLTAELGVIAGEIKIIAALIGIMIGLALLLGGLLYTGGWLFLGEWLFGSIGWGLLHGALFTVAMIAVLGLTLVAGSARPAALGFVLAAILGVVLTVVLASNVLRSASVWLADQVDVGLRLDAGAVNGLHASMIGLAVVAAVIGFLAFLVSGGIKAAIAGILVGGILGALFGFMLGGDSLAAALPILSAAVVGALVFGVIGLIVGGRAGGAVRGLFLGAFAGLFVGALAGAITYDNRGAGAVALTVAIIAWPALAFVLARRDGLDPSKRFGRLVPRESIAAAKETRSWLEQEWQRQRKKLTSR